jgi:CRP-like cAMP-binding protein
MYVILRGAVGISIQSPDGGEALLAVLEPPASFGELAVVDRGPRVAMATARQPTELLRIERSTVLDLVATEPVVGAALISSLVAMVRRVDEQTSDLALLGLPLRVRKHLLGVALHQHGSRPVLPGGAIHVDLRINQTDLARQVGGSRQQVNRILAALDGAGAIERMGHRIVAVRPDLLAVEE